MGSIDFGAKAPISSIPKRVYYVLTFIGLYSGATIYVSASSTPKLGWGDAFSSRTVSGAKQFASVSAAIAFARETARVRTDQSLDLNISIVRVEETAGTEQRVVLGETQEAPKGAVVKYAIYGEGARAFLSTGEFASWTGFDVQEARLFESQSAAIGHIVDKDLGGRITIKRIAVSAATPTLTETVLS